MEEWKMFYIFILVINKWWNTLRTKEKHSNEGKSK